ncbi:MAG TPA: magnesium transporter CorA family protein, partial [Dehalococcoidia bacterium]|nr:magnesium transporter CorA family protein [Dehalococcoidia bacterium]
MAKAAKIEAPEVKREARLDMVSGEGCTWLNVEKPTHKELDYLAQFYPFHPMDLDDCISHIQLSKLDEYSDYLFVILHFPLFNKRTRFTTASQVSIFVGKDFLVTVHSGDLKPLVNLFKECQEKEEARQEYLGKDPGFLLYRLVDALVDSCLPMLDKVLANLERVEDEVFDETVDAAQEVAVLRRDIAAQRRIFWPMKAVVADLEQKAQRFTKVDLKVYFGDINDHINRIWNTLEEAKETVEIYKDTDYVLSQDRLQRIMAILTIIIAI